MCNGWWLKASRGRQSFTEPVVLYSHIGYKYLKWQDSATLDELNLLKGFHFLQVASVGIAGSQAV